MDNLYILVPVLIAAFIMFIFLNKMAVNGINKTFYKNKWDEIEAAMEKGEMGYKLAVIEADKLLDHALKAQGYRGKTMGERLKSANSILVDKDSVWEAHKFRNRLVHEQNVKVTSKKSRSSLNSFKKALKGLGVI